jgi:hypothetical protein
MDEGALADGRRVRAGIVVTGLLDAADTAQAAVEAERAGWDAVFVWEAVWGLDAWVRLTAAAAATTRVRLGTMLTPLPRIRPWDLASRAVTLDRFSGGRLQLAVGLGAPHEGWTAFEPDPGRRERARLLEEGLAVYDGLMRGQPFTFTGSRYVVRPTTFAVPPPPVQRPRVPVWVVGAWDAVARSEGGDPVTPGLRRAARWDGLLPAVLGDRSWSQDGTPPTRVREPAGPEELAAVVDDVRRLRADAGLPWDGYAVVREAGPSAEDRAAVAAWADAGVTWWVQADWEHDGAADLSRQIAAGPPA